MAVTVTLVQFVSIGNLNKNKKAPISGVFLCYNFYMSETKLDKKNLGSSILLSVLAIIIFLGWYIPKYSLHAITATKECAEIYKEKAPGYFGTAGSNRFVFNKKMNTCFLLNIVSDDPVGAYRLIAVDMISDDIIFYYDLKGGETKDLTLNITKDEALDRIRALGFVIF